jgi:putative protease
MGYSYQYQATTMEEKIGVVTDYLNRIGVAVIRLTDGDLHVGDHVRIAGRTSELTQAVESLQVEHQRVEQAFCGSEVALKVREQVRRHDEVFLVREG